MKKVFVLILDYDENEEGMFTDVGVEATFENQLFDLKDAGLIERYEDVVAYEVVGTLSDNIMELIEEDNDGIS